VGGWVFIGLDACVSAAEETRDTARHVPKAIWIALLSVGTLVIVDAVAATLAHPDPTRFEAKYGSAWHFEIGDGRFVTDEHEAAMFRIEPAKCWPSPRNRTPRPGTG
jgi:amino acid transporter